MDTLQDFTELDVWKECRKLNNKIRELIQSFPQNERYLLSDQLIRASRSVTANIAEGFGRFHYRDNARFCRQARGSLYEILDHLICAYDNKYISVQKLQTLECHIRSCKKLLNGYIKHLIKKSNIKKQCTNNH